MQNPIKMTLILIVTKITICWDTLWILTSCIEKCTREHTWEHTLYIKNNNNHSKRKEICVLYKLYFILFSLIKWYKNCFITISSSIEIYKTFLIVQYLWLLNMKQVENVKLLNNMKENFVMKSFSYYNWKVLYMLFIHKTKVLTTSTNNKQQTIFVTEKVWKDTLNEFEE